MIGLGNSAPRTSSTPGMYLHVTSSQLKQARDPVSCYLKNTMLHDWWTRECSPRSANVASVLQTVPTRVWRSPLQPGWGYLIYHRSSNMDSLPSLHSLPNTTLNTGRWQDLRFTVKHHFKHGSPQPLHRAGYFQGSTHFGLHRHHPTPKWCSCSAGAGQR